MENVLQSPMVSNVGSVDSTTSSELSKKHITEDFNINVGTNLYEMGPVPYQKMPHSKETFLAYVVAIRDPLNLHLDIYWPKEFDERYNSVIKYEYTFISEELEEKIYTRNAFLCHLRGIEINSADFSHMRETYIEISKRILRSGGWVLVSVSDVDIYKRILVNIFDVTTRQSINNNLLQIVSKRTGEHIVKEYIRPARVRTMFHPISESLPKDYHIIFSSRNN